MGEEIYWDSISDKEIEEILSAFSEVGLNTQPPEYSISEEEIEEILSAFCGGRELDPQPRNLIDEPIPAVRLPEPRGHNPFIRDRPSGGTKGTATFGGSLTLCLH